MYIMHKKYHNFFSSCKFILIARSGSWHLNRDNLNLFISKNLPDNGHICQVFLIFRLPHEDLVLHQSLVSLAIQCHQLKILRFTHGILI